jgi:hypothetical protein
VKAAVAATVAVGTYEMLRRKEESHNSHFASGHSTNAMAYPTSPKPKHHTKYMLEEATGLYALGSELLGDKRHPAAHLVAEAVRATGLSRISVIAFDDLAACLACIMREQGSQRAGCLTQDERVMKEGATSYITLTGKIFLM